MNRLLAPGIGRAAGWRPPDEAVGHGGIRAIAGQSWAQMATTRPWNCHEVIDVGGDRATGSADVNAMAQAQDGTWHQGAAACYDIYIRLAPEEPQVTTRILCRAGQDWPRVCP